MLFWLLYVPDTSVHLTLQNVKIVHWHIPTPFRCKATAKSCSCWIWRRFLGSSVQATLLHADYLNIDPTCIYLWIKHISIHRFMCSGLRLGNRVLFPLSYALRVISPTYRRGPLLRRQWDTKLTPCNRLLILRLHSYTSTILISHIPALTWE